MAKFFYLVPIVLKFVRVKFKFQVHTLPASVIFKRSKSAVVAPPPIELITHVKRLSYPPLSDYFSYVKDIPGESFKEKKSREIG